MDEGFAGVVVVVVVVEGYAKSVALASDTVSRVWVDMTSRVVGVNPYVLYTASRVPGQYRSQCSRVCRGSSHRGQLGSV